MGFKPAMEEAFICYEELRDAHRELYEKMFKIRQCVVAKELDQSELVDVAFLMRESAKFSDDLRKEANRVKSVCENVACAEWIIQATKDPTTPEKIKGTFANGTPDLRQISTPPKKKSDPEAYEAMMNYFGIPQDMIDGDMLHIHYPSYCDHLTRLAEEGKPLPPGANKDSTKTEYTLKLRKVSRVDIDEFLDDRK